MIESLRTPGFLTVIWILGFKGISAAVSTTIDPIIATKACLSSDQARQEAIARCYKPPRNPTDCTTLFKNMDCFINETKHICNDPAYSLTDLTFYRNMQTTMLNQQGLRPQANCTTSLVARLKGYHCQACTGADPLITKTGDDKYLDFVPDLTQPAGQCRNLSVVCRPADKFWKSKLNLIGSAGAGSPIGVGTGFPGKPAMLTVACQGSPVKWVINQQEVIEAKCESKSAEDGCALCNESSITWNKEVQKRRADVDGCMIISFDCQAPPLWRSQVSVNNKQFDSTPGGKISVTIKCIGDRNTYNWVETTENIQDVTSASCVKKFYEDGCAGCDEKGIAWKDVTPTVETDRHGCKYVRAECKAPHPNSQSQLQLDGNRMITSPPGGFASIKLECKGDSKRQVWKARIGPEIFDATTVTCVPSKFVGNRCAWCKTATSSQLFIRGDSGLIHVSYKYEQDGCVSVVANCAPVNEESTSSIEFRKYGEKTIIDQAVAPGPGQTAKLRMTCTRSTTWKKDGNEIACYTKAPKDFNCTEATMFAPKLTLYGDVKSIILKQRAPLPTTYFLNCQPQAGYDSRFLLEYLDSKTGRPKTRSLVGIRAKEMDLRCDEGKWLANYGDFISAKCEAAFQQG